MKISELEEKIRMHQRFYDLGKSRISDEQFDKLVATLKKHRPDSPVLQEIGIKPSGKQITHKTPMLSLDKAYNLDEIKKFCKSVKHDFIVQPKYDGLACNLLYDEDGLLKCAATRGNGTVGEDITRNAKLLFSLPLKIPFEMVEIRGEVLIPKSIFKKKYKDKYANARNLVAGIMNRKDADPEVLRDIVFVAHDVVGSEDYGKQISKLEVAGFVVGANTQETDFDGVAAAIRDYQEDRDSFDYDLDGVVVKARRLSDRQKLGATAHHPKWAIAFKFQGESGTTTLRWVRWQVSRTGTITPVAVVDPVELSGASIQNVTLHHLAHFIELDLHQGDRVLITRRGGIIPHLESVVKKSRSGSTIPQPSSCPSCGGSVVRRGDFLSCSKDASCPGVRVGKLEHWASVMDMDGWGGEVILKAYSKGVIRTPYDFYRRDLYGHLERLPGLGETSAHKLCNEVYKKITFDMLLRGLGIEGIGKVTAKKIMRHFKTIETLIAWATEDQERDLVYGGPDIGQKTEIALIYGVRENIDLIEALLERITLEPYKESDGVNTQAKGPFVGKAVVFTGPLSDMDRDEARRLVRQLGGTTPDGVTREVDLLVVGDGARDAQQGKRKKAARYQIKIITEAEWAELLAEAMSENP